MDSGRLLVPVGFFIFNRIETTKKVFEAIREAGPPKLYLVSDAARPGRAGEDCKVREVREYVESHIDWECEVRKNYATENMGCKRRMASGISWVFENEEMAIILEDDCLPSQTFFRFCQEMLNKYKDDERISIIGGYKIVPTYEIKEDYIFSYFASIWGWASWRRAWELYDMDMTLWPDARKKGTLRRQFSNQYYKAKKEEYDKVCFGNFDTWDFQWGFARTINNTLGIIPKNNLIQNIGFGPDATHTVSLKRGVLGEREEMEFPVTFQKYVIRDVGYDELHMRNVARSNRKLRLLKLVKKFLYRK